MGEQRQRSRALEAYEKGLESLSPKERDLRRQRLLELEKFSPIKRDDGEILDEIAEALRRSS